MTGDRSERFHRGEPANDRAVPGHPLDAEGESHGQHGRQSFGHGCHRQGDREDDDSRCAGDPFCEDANDAERHGEDQHPARDLPAQLIDAAFEWRRRGLDVAEHGGQPAMALNRPVLVTSR